MSIFRPATTLACALALLAFAAPASAAELPAYELDPTLSLRGECKVEAFDPIPDPSCVGEPPAYPAPPAGPAERFNYPRAIAVDSFGDEYVASWAETNDAKGHVDVFDDEGFFITEVAAPNAQSIAVDSKGNLYVFEDSGKIVRYEPSKYDGEAGDIAYGGPPVTVVTGSFVGALDIDRSNDRLYVAQGNGVTIYGSAEESNAVFDVVGLVGEWVEAIAVDSQRRRMYVTSCEEGNITGCGVKVFEADDPYNLLEEIYEVPTEPAPTKFAALFAQMGLAVDEVSGDFFVADIPPAKTVYRFGEGYEYLSQLKSSKFTTNIAIQIAVSNGKRSPLAGPCGYPDPKAVSVPAGQACNRHDLFVPVLEAAGRAIAFHPPAQTQPVIEAVSSGAIGEVEAELRARILPGGQDTEYAFELTTQASFEAEGFQGATTVGQGTIPAGSLASEVSAHAGGLLPGQSYRFRAVAENGLGEAAQGADSEGAFATYEDATSPGSCPNQVLRSGASARLPDCRAYELVTPPETNGRAPKGGPFVGNVFPTVESSSSGDAVGFKVVGGSLPGGSGIGGFDGDPYLATRNPSGWSSALVGPSGDEATAALPGSSSPDQGYSFWTARLEGPRVIDKIDTEYLRYPDGHSELIGRGSLGTDPRAKGRLITEDGSHIVWETIQIGSGVPIQLEPNAPPTGTRAVYDRTSDEVTHVVSLLPGEVTPAAGQNAAYVGASPDGEGIAFELANKLYLRLGNEATYEIGTGVTFAGVSEGGDRVFYVEGGDLKAFDTGSEEVIDFSTTGDVTPVNVAEEGARAYFVSPSVIGGANPQGDAPVPPASGQGILGAEGSGTLAAAKGTGTLTSEWTHVTGVLTEEGTFQRGMQVTGAGIPSGTTIKAIEPNTLILSQPATQSGPSALTANSTKVTGLSTSAGVFDKGMRITGNGIPAATTIQSVGPNTLTLSNAATQSGSTALVAGSRTVTDVSTGAGTFRVGMSITGTGIPAGTVITAIDAGTQALTLSKEAAATGSQPLSAFAQNLYLSEEGAIGFIGTLTGRDVEGEQEGTADGLGLWTDVLATQPAKDPSRLNPDGSVLLFQSRAGLTGYDPGEFTQVFRYDSGTDRLQCISCVPTGAAAGGGSSLEHLAIDYLSSAPLTPSAFVHNLSPDGKRAFFESSEALVSADTDGVRDVYEWEAQGVGSCNRSDGCVYLISSGQSARDNYLYAQSTDGADVFFSSEDRLNGEDPSSTRSIYDARVGGGFASSQAAGECLGEACQPVAVAPDEPIPVLRGPGNATSPAKARASCPKGKRKVKARGGRTRCVSRHHRRAAGHGKGAGR